VEKITIEITAENGQGKVSIRHNDQPIPNLFGFDISFNQRLGQLSFAGHRLATDEAGQYFIDPETKETALEDVNMIAFFNKDYRIKERIKRTLQELEFAMKNIHDTSFHNTQKLFEKYGV
jgi:hypothetical protein